MRSNNKDRAFQSSSQGSLQSPLQMQNRGAVHFLSVFSSVALTIFIVFLVGLIPVNTDVSQYKELLMPKIFSRLYPEPLEMPQYALTVILLPCLYFAANLLFKRIIKEKQHLYIALAFDVVLFLAAGAIGLCGFETKVEFGLNYNLFFLPICVLLTIFILFACHIERRQYPAISGELPGKIFFFLIFAVSVIMGFYYMHRVNHMLQDSEHSMHHFYAWWYPVYKVGSGMTIGVDFDCLYGFYPYFIVPFLKLLGGVNQHSFSIYIATVLSLISVCYFFFSYRFIKSKLLAGVTGFAASFYGPLASEYLAWNPSRTLFPALVLGGAAVYSCLKGKGKIIMRVFMALLLGLGIAWNIEMGVVAVISWAGYLIFLSGEENGLFDKKSLINIVKVALLSLLSIAAAAAFIELVTYHRSARFIGMGSILFGQTVFAGTGFFMVKMKFNTWMLSAIPIAAGLFASLPYITKNRAAVKMPSDKIAALFTVSIVAIGSYSYFIGRSVPSNSRHFLVYAALICGILTELYYERAVCAGKNGCDIKLRIMEKAKVFLSVMIVAIVSVWAASNVLKFYSDDYYKNHLSSTISSEVVYSAAQDIKEWADKNELQEMPHLLISQSCYVNEALGRPSTENVCEQMDWFYRKNAHTYIDFILAHKGESFVIDEYAQNTLKELYPEDFAKAIENFELSQALPAKTVDQDDTLFFAYLPAEPQV